MDVSYDPEDKKRNVFKGKIVEVYDKGLMFRTVVDIGFRVVNLTMRRSFLDMNLRKASPVYLSIDERSVHILEDGR